MPRLNMPGSNGAGACSWAAPSSASDSVVTPFERFLLWERSSRDTLEVKRAYIDMADDLVAGIMLSQIVYWHLPDREGRTRLRIQREGMMWLAKGRADWWDECRISPKQADRALERLRKLGVIETKLFRFNGAPTVHLRISQERFMQAWQAAISDQSDQSDLSDQSDRSDTSDRSDFTQTSKSISPNGKEPSCREGEIHMPGRATSITESPSENTSQTTTTPSPKTSERTTDVVVALVEELVGAGVTRSRAEDLATRHSPEAIRDQIAMLPFRNGQEPAAMLVKAIEGSWAPPHSYRKEIERRRREALGQAETDRIEREKAEARAAEARRQAERDAWWKAQDPGLQSRMLAQATENLYKNNPGLRHSAAIKHTGRVFRGMREMELRKLIDERMGEG